MNSHRASRTDLCLACAGETSDELAGLATCMREKALTVDTPHDVVDIVGTGGDGIGSVNMASCIVGLVLVEISPGK